MMGSGLVAIERVEPRGNAKWLSDLVVYRISDVIDGSLERLDANALAWIGDASQSWILQSDSAIYCCGKSGFGLCQISARKGCCQCLQRLKAQDNVAKRPL